MHNSQSFESKIPCKLSYLYFVISADSSAAQMTHRQASLSCGKEGELPEESGPCANIAMDVAEIRIGAVVAVCQRRVLLFKGCARGGFAIAAVQQDLQDSKHNSSRSAQKMWEMCFEAVPDTSLQRFALSLKEAQKLLLSQRW